MRGLIWVKIFVSIALVILTIHSVYAQKKPIPNSTMNFELDFVRWVSEFPVKKSDKKKKGIAKGFNEFIFGKKTEILDTPIAVVADNSDEYWILDQKNGVLISVDKEEGEFVKIKPREDQHMGSLVGVCKIADWGFVFTESRNNQVYVLKEGSKKLVSLGDSIEWQQPTGIAYNKLTDDIWVLETKSHQVTIIGKDGIVKKVFGSRGIKEGEFNYPTHIWIDNQGTAYIVDAMNFRVQMFNSAGDFVSMFGKAGDGTGYFARPKGVATDSHGNIYVVDALFHNVQIFDKTGQLLYFFGTQGREQGQFWMPNGIYIDEHDNIFVADSYNSRVQIFKLINRK